MAQDCAIQEDFVIGLILDPESRSLFSRCHQFDDICAWQPIPCINSSTYVSQIGLKDLSSVQICYQDLSFIRISYFKPVVSRVGGDGQCGI